MRNNQWSTYSIQDSKLFWNHYFSRDVHQIGMHEQIPLCQPWREWYDLYRVTRPRSGARARTRKNLQKLLDVSRVYVVYVVPSVRQSVPPICLSQLHVTGIPSCMSSEPRSWLRSWSLNPVIYVFLREASKQTLTKMMCDSLFLDVQVLFPSIPAQ